MPSRRKAITLRLGRRRGDYSEFSRELSAAPSQSYSLGEAQRQRADEILHELKSPLARLSVALGLARQQTGDNAQEALDRIELEAGKLKRMLQQLLGLARMEAVMELPAAEEINLVEMVKGVIADTNFEAIRSNRTVRLISSESCTIHGVRDMLRSVVENVARNALAHTAEGTAVDIAIACPEIGDVVRAIITVRDRGQGVPHTLLSQIFNPFFRVEDSSSRKSGGTGLGLAIAQRAVSLHGGTISATNHPEGGLVVEIMLPVTSLSSTAIPLATANASVLN